MVAFNSAQRRNVPVWTAATHAFQVTIAGGGAPTTIDLSSDAAVASGGVGEGNELRTGYVMICNQGTNNLTIQNKSAITDYANHGITLTPGATFEFAVGKMKYPEGTANSISVKGAAADVFTVIYFED